VKEVTLEMVGWWEVCWWEVVIEIGTSGANVGLVWFWVDDAGAYEPVEVACYGPFVVACSPLGRWQPGG
jgi:hypothetical protein